jgi:hypothetical protein
MDNDELLKINAKITFDEILANQKDLEEFNKLGSKNEEVRDFILTVMPFGFLILANIFFTIDTELFQVLCIIFFASSVVQGMVTAESKKTNRRIDLLLKIINQDQSKTHNKKINKDT